MSRRAVYVSDSYTYNGKNASVAVDFLLSVLQFNVVGMEAMTQLKASVVSSARTLGPV